jgi:zinc transporter ZupT
MRSSSRSQARSNPSLYPGLDAAFLAFAAGAMIYVSVDELYPMARRLGHVTLFAAGACLAVATTALLHIAIPSCRPARKSSPETHHRPPSSSV